jgi:hypothetical protein
MAHRVNIALADDEYQMFLAEAEKSNEKLEVYLHRLIREHLCTLLQSSRPSDREFQLYLSRRGIVYRIPTDQCDVSGEEAERKRLTDL